MQLKGNTFLVTGGASGLGAACARRFVGLGANVVIVDMSKAGEALAAELGSQARFVATDVSKEADVRKAVETAHKQFGGLQGVLNCAGIAVAEKVLNKEGKVHSLESFSKVLTVNLIGTFNVIRLAVQSMVKDPAVRATEERGVIINTASVAAFEGQLGQCAYSASKGGIVALTLPLARELAQYGIRVVTIAPGIFDTPMLAGLDEKVRAALGQMVPFPPRLGNPDEYASLAQQICENPMLNGEVIRLDGAIRMAAR